MKILVCSNVFPPTVIGGAELIAYHHAKVLRDKGCEVNIFCGDLFGPEPLYSMRETLYEGMATYRVRLANYLNFCHPRIEQQFESILERFQPDIVHMHNLIGLSAGLIGRAKHRGFSTVLTVHDHWGMCHKNTLLKTSSDVCKDQRRCFECLPRTYDSANRAVPIRLRRDFIAMQLACLDALISPSVYLSMAYGRADISTGVRRVIEYGIDLNRYSQVSKSPRNEEVRFTFIGYLGPHKGVALLIDAAQILRPANVIINLVGTGELIAQLRERVENENLSDIVRFWGKIENQSIEKVYRETDVLLLPSIWPENQPVTILEAMATRTPVIASRIGGIPEIVIDGVTGYLFEPGNAMDMANRMAIFVAHPERIVEFGAAGFERIREYSYDNSIAKILDLYQEVRVAAPRASEERDDSSPLIACAGNRFEDEAAEAVDWIDRSRQHDSWRFAMHDWLAGTTIARPKVFWVVDDATPVEGVYAALQSRVPLLVPDNHPELKELCRQENCGLYYRNAAEAFECLEYLLSSSAVSSAMGYNGFAYWTHSRTGQSYPARSSAQTSGH